MRTSRVLTSLAAAAVVLGLLAARPAPTADITVNGTADSIDVTGSAVFADVPVHALFDSTGDTDGVPGTDVAGGTIVQPDPFTNELDFVLELADPLPEHSILPEGVFYEWSVNVAGAEYRLTVVGNDLGNGSVEHEISIWVCGDPDPQTGVADCTSEPIGGTVDGELITWHVPYNRIGAGVGASIVTTGFRIVTTAGVPGVGRVTGGLLLEEAAGFEPYEIARPTVAVEISTASDTEPVQVVDDSTTLSSNEVDLSFMLDAGTYDVVVTTCYGSCTTTQVDGVTVGE